MSKEQKTSRVEVAVVGAGPAGIAAATRLMLNGISNILVLEAEERIGGRLYSKQFGSGVVDLGAQFCHGEKGNVVYEMAHPLGLLESSMTFYNNMSFVDSTGTTLDEDTGSWLLGLCLDIADKAGTELVNYQHSLGDFITTEFQKQVNNSSSTIKISKTIADQFLQWFHRFENSIDGSDSWFETSGIGHTEYWECEGDPVLIWKKSGYSRVLDLLMKKIPNPNLAIPVESKILFRKEVSKIDWNGNEAGSPVVLHCTDGHQIKADRVIVTVSLGVLKDRVQTLFCPPLTPLKVNAISGLAIGTVNKIFLKFPHSWWPEHIAGFSLMWTKDDAEKFAFECNQYPQKSWLRELFGFYVDHGQPGVLCGWIVGPAARSMEKCSDSEVLVGCQELLHRFLGQVFDIPVIQSITRSSWHTNPHFRGSYSFRSMESDRVGAKACHLAEPLINNHGQKVVMFAGEATHDHYFSTVHGAIETGWREADRVIKDTRVTRSSL